MLEIRRLTTAALDPTELAAIRALVDRAFSNPSASERFDDHDWHHTLGGHHVLGLSDGTLVAHAGVVPRVLWCGGVPRRTGFVEAVAVEPSRQRQGFGAAIMAEVERLIRERYELGALSAGDAAQRLYRRLGWVLWRGPSYVATPRGPVATPGEDGHILVLPRPGLDVTEPIACDWREGDVW